MIDGHIHIERGEYTLDWINQFVRRAVEMNLDEIRLLEHNFRFEEFVPMYDSVCAYSDFVNAWFHRVGGVKKLDDYLRLIDQVRGEKWPVRIKFGLEVCYFKEFEDLTAKLTQGKGFDFLLGSIHFVNDFAFDHTADLPVLMYRLDAMGFGADGRQLPVYGPVDESSAIRKIIASSACFTLKDIAPGDTVAIGDCTVHVGDARHPVPAIGFRAECGGRIFGYTGDTNTLPSLPSFYQGCHLLLADGLFPESAWAEQKPHLSAALAAAIAREAKAEKLVLTHLNPLFSSDTLLREARKNHAQVTLAAQGACMEI